MSKINIPPWLFVAIGFLSVALGVIGIFLPILPTTPLLLLAAGCFVRSSPRFYDWLIRQPWLGPYIRNYREHRGITLRDKVATLILLWGCMGSTMIFAMTSWWARGLLAAVAIGVTVHILSFKTLR
ncbi:MAG: YbaN family protein [Anaerolineae bacterium]|nr:YbaN family protein [Anaerolineae bacterium]